MAPEQTGRTNRSIDSRADLYALGVTLYTRCCRCRRMSEDDKKKPDALKARPNKDDYEVGFGKPPKESQFRKGQSGNPKGRPRGAKTKNPGVTHNRLWEILLQEAYREISLRDGEREVRVPVMQAIIRSTAVKAVRGNVRSAELLTQLLSSTERAQSQQHDALLREAIAYKTEWEKEIARCKRLGLSEPDLVPHPNDIVVDPFTGNVSITGPLWEKQRQEMDEMTERRAGFESSLAELKQDLLATRDLTEARMIRADIAHTERMLKIIAQVLPDEDPVTALIKRFNAKQITK